MRISQKDAVYEVSMRVLEENGVIFEEGVDVLVDVIDRDIRSTIVSILVESFKEDKIVMNKRHEGKNLRRYASGLISNWAKKDTRLNGNVEYRIKNPGSRVGTTDPMVRELRKFLKQVKGTKHEEDVKKELSIRLNSIRKEQVKDIVINTNLIPDSIKHLVKNRGSHEETTSRH